MAQKTKKMQQECFKIIERINIQRLAWFWEEKIDDVENHNLCMDLNNLITEIKK